MAQLRESVWTKAALYKTAPEERAARARSRGFDEVDDVDRLLYVTVPFLREGASLLIAQGRLDRERLRSRSGTSIPRQPRLTTGARGCWPKVRKP